MCVRVFVSASLWVRIFACVRPCVHFVCLNQRSLPHSIAKPFAYFGRKNPIKLFPGVVAGTHPACSKRFFNMLIGCGSPKAACSGPVFSRSAASADARRWLLQCCSCFGGGYVSVWMCFCFCSCVMLVCLCVFFIAFVYLLNCVCVSVCVCSLFVCACLIFAWLCICLFACVCGSECFCASVCVS